MTGFSFKPKEPGHVRTCSDPPKVHPTLVKLEEDAHNLKAGVNTSNEVMLLCKKLREVGSLYKSIDELQLLQAFCSTTHERKWVEEQLEDSIKLLDLVNAVRECAIFAKEHVQDARLGLRRKGDNANVGVVAYRKKVQKEVKGCYKLLKHVEAWNGGLVRDWDLMVVDKVVKDLREAVIGLVRGVLCLLSKKGRKEELEEMEAGIRGIENELELLFRRLIQNRVFLLNILSL